MHAALTLEAQTFDEIVDALDLVWSGGQRALRLSRGISGLVAVSEHCIGANQAHPSVNIVTIGVQPIR
jgi:hypothetical protein